MANEEVKGKSKITLEHKKKRLQNSLKTLMPTTGLCGFCLFWTPTPKLLQEFTRKIQPTVIHRQLCAHLYFTHQEQGPSQSYSLYKKETALGGQGLCGWRDPAAH